MVRKLKRKSEGDLPNSRSKTRKNGSYKTDMNVSDQEEESSGVPEQFDRKVLKRDGKDKKREKKGERMSEPARIGERELGEREKDEDEDSGREASNEFLELDNLERKKKKSAERAKAQFMEKFIGSVERDVKDFKESAAELEREDSVESMEFLEGFHAAYSLSAPFKTDSYDFSLNHRRGQNMITRALELNSHFDKLAKKDIAKELAGLFSNEWSKEDEEIAKMLELGKIVGLNKFECIVNASDPEILETNALEASKKFYPVVEGEGSSGWGKEAKKHERAHKKLLKAFESRS